MSTNPMHEESMYEERERLVSGTFMQSSDIEHVQLHVVRPEKYKGVYIRVEYVDTKNNTNKERRCWDYRIGSISPVPVGTFPLTCGVHELKVDGSPKTVVFNLGEQLGASEYNRRQNLPLHSEIRDFEFAAKQDLLEHYECCGHRKEVVITRCMYGTWGEEFLCRTRRYKGDNELLRVPPLDAESKERCFTFYHGENSSRLFTDEYEGDCRLTLKDYRFLIEETEAKRKEGGLVHLYTSRREKNWKYLRPSSFGEKIELNMIEKFIHSSIGNEFIETIKFSRHET